MAELSHSAEPLLELHEVSVASFHDPERVQVADVNWTIRRGEFWVVAGLHSSGKTSLLATAAGLQRPLSGVVRWFGRPVDELREAELVEDRRRIGVVFDNGRMLRGLSVIENILLPLEYRSGAATEEAEARVEAILVATGLKARTAQTAGTLNPSWQQRVGLARALVLQPEVLLIDRPLLGAGSFRWWGELLERLNTGDPLTGGRPTTLVVATDDVATWTRAGRQLAFIREGRFQVSTADAAGELWREA